MKIINVLGVLDTFRDKKGTMQHYQKKLLHFKEEEAKILINIGMIHFENEYFEEAKNYFQEALKIYKKINFEEGQASTFQLLGDVYISERNPSKAIPKYQESFKIYASLKSPLKKKLFTKIKDAEKAEQVMEIIKHKKDTE